MSLNLDSTVVRSTEIMAQEVDDELVMMHLETSQYLGLNPVGRRIWELTESPTSIGEICQQLASEYEVEMDVCQREVLAFLSDLRDSQVVALVATR